MLEFNLNIKLGNDNMMGADDVAKALEKLAEKLRYSGALEGKIMDANGNNVGEYQFVTED